MPNWVYNSVTVEGDKKEVEKFKSTHFNEKEFDFNTIIPMPNHIFRGDLGTKEREKHGSNNWYDWSIFNWGTKWNAGYTEFYSDDISKRGKKYVLDFKFDTAWSVPMPIYYQLAKMYPKLSISVSYDEEGMGFAGDLEIKNGKVKEYERNPEEGMEEEHE